MTEDDIKLAEREVGKRAAVALLITFVAIPIGFFLLAGLWLNSVEPQLPHESVR